MEMKMKNTLIILLLIVAVTTSMTVAQENRHTSIQMTPGMKIFKKKMRKGCRSTAIKFSRAHTQHQWQIIKDNGLLRREAKALCPRLDTSLLSDRDWNNVYTFVNNHAKDNPVIIKC